MPSLRFVPTNTSLTGSSSEANVRGSAMEGPRVAGGVQGLWGVTAARGAPFSSFQKAFNWVFMRYVHDPFFQGHMGCCGSAWRHRPRVANLHHDHSRDLHSKPSTSHHPIGRQLAINAEHHQAEALPLHYQQPVTHS